MEHAPRMFWVLDFAKDLLLPQYAYSTFLSRVAGSFASEHPFLHTWNKGFWERSADVEFSTADLFFALLFQAVFYFCVAVYLDSRKRSDFSARSGGNLPAEFVKGRPRSTYQLVSVLSGGCFVLLIFYR